MQNVRSAPLCRSQAGEEVRAVPEAMPTSRGTSQEHGVGVGRLGPRGARKEGWLVESRPWERGGEEEGRARRDCSLKTVMDRSPVRFLFTPLSSPLLMCVSECTSVFRELRKSLKTGLNFLSAKTAAVRNFKQPQSLGSVIK